MSQITLDRLRHDGDAAVDCIMARPEAAIAACPGWTAMALGGHLSGVWEFWARVVAERLTTIEAVKAVGRPKPSTDPDVLRANLAALGNALETAPAELSLWSWAGGSQPVSWVARRMVQETAVHRWDAEQARATTWSMHPEVATDGIDEFFEWFSADPQPDAIRLTEAVELRCTDTDQSFVVAQIDVDSIGEVDQVPASALSGRAEDLLLWLWRRPHGPLVSTGDTEQLTRLRRFTNLD